MKVEIRNFQSLSKVVMEFPPGITAIVGENNMGKTAVFRCLQTVLFNLPADSFIKMGTSGSACSIEERGHKIVWRKVKNPKGGLSKTTYWVDGEEATKVGKGQFEMVRSALDIFDIPIFGKRVRLNFWNQEEMPFLMDVTPSKIFEFLSQSSGEGNLSDVVRDMRTDLNAMISDTRVLDGAIDAIRLNVGSEVEFLESKEGFEKLHNRIIALDSEVMKYDKISEGLQQIEISSSIVKSEEQVIAKIGGMLAAVKAPYESASTLFQKSAELAGVVSGCDNDVKARELAIEEKDRASKMLAKFSLEGIQEKIDWITALRISVDSLYDSIFIVDKFKLIGTELVETASAIKKSLDEVIKELNQVEVCPLCGQTLPDHRSEHAHGN